MLDAVVVGGGIAGLACALALTDHGLKVVVLERDALLGGRARSWTDGETGDRVDIGPHVLHSEYRNMLALLERLGTRDRVVWQPQKVLTLATKPPVVLRHWPLPTPLSMFPSLIGAPGLTARDLVSNTRTITRGMTYGEEEVPALDGVDALTYLRGLGVREAMIDWWWRFASIVLCAAPLEQCSAAALMRVHAQLSGHRRIHFGFAAEGLADLYAPAALREIEASGGHVRTGARVKAISGAERAEGVILDSGERIAARHCVVALPPQDLGPLLPDAWKRQGGLSSLDAFEPTPYVSVYLWFDRKITRERFWSHLWSPDRLNYDFYDLSNIRPALRDRPSLVASNIIHRRDAHAMSDAEIVAATRREIAEFAPRASEARVVHAVVNRIAMAVACPHPGIERRRLPARTGVPGFVLAGDWTRTHLPSSMESAARSGYLAAEAVLADRGVDRTLALRQRAPDGLSGIVRRATRLRRGVQDEP